MRSVNQLSDALSNGSTGQAQAVDILRQLPNVMSNLSSFVHLSSKILINAYSTYLMTLQMYC